MRSIRARRPRSGSRRRRSVTTASSARSGLRLEDDVTTGRPWAGERPARRHADSYNYRPRRPASASLRTHERSRVFDKLASRLSAVVEGVTGRGRLTEENIADTLRQVRMALLE